jgi:GDPmannose 4,6-dehydratase
MWLMLQQDKPDDYVLATGISTPVREFVTWAFAEVGMALEWKGQGVAEKGYDAAGGKCLVEVDPRYFRPTEVDHLVGDATKARKVLGWTCEIGARDICTEMVREDIKTVAEERRRNAD